MKRRILLLAIATSVATPAMAKGSYCNRFPVECKEDAERYRQWFNGLTQEQRAAEVDRRERDARRGGFLLFGLFGTLFAGLSAFGYFILKEPRQ